MNKERILERLNDYKRATARLDEATKIPVDYDVIYDGVIQRFEFTFELSWKLMKMFLEYNGITEIRSPRMTIKEAYAHGLIENGEQWIDMMIDRNKTSHLYDEKEIRLIYEKVNSMYNRLLSDLYIKLEREMLNLM